MPKTLPVVDMSQPVCCSPVAAGPLDDEAALEIALRLKALADPARVKLVSLLFGVRLARSAVATWRRRSDWRSRRSAITSRNCGGQAWWSPSGGA